MRVFGVSLLTCFAIVERDSIVVKAISAGLIVLLLLCQATCHVLRRTVRGKSPDQMHPQDRWSVDIKDCATQWHLPRLRIVGGGLSENVQIQVTIGFIFNTIGQELGNRACVSNYRLNLTIFMPFWKGTTKHEIVRGMFNVEPRHRHDYNNSKKSYH